ncbi:MFS transporter [Agrobacterium rubi]|uniref:MFS transporter n=1 Tax=Agrobacterium rubi TaxID=28099 RepID=A0AAE7R2S6_9HYPH|nr:MFS transporter [Agrobacterium rubi]NTE87690.1 MFS transporter [Agrobacterium rubi]NTF03544.1 MFS transporter [Agrobacterium rubi]NTF37704.1 MFS transporter [Agrobacterium rubi]OCJ45615.1 MFS transporter [Agrobacterium rubi]QTG00134.1 MFS transporter [Agrobacterium rubi]
MASSSLATGQSVTKRGIWGWMLFDWAAQPFFTVVTTFIFGPYFVARLTADPISAQTTWSNMATISSVIIAIFSPILGSIADQSGSRKPWIAFFATLKIASLAMLWFAAPGSAIIWPVTFMIVASIAAEFSIVFNDSMMPRLTTPENVGRISNTAWGLGYLGGMVVLIFVVLFLAAAPDKGVTILGIPPLFGLDPAAGEDARITGPISALWYFVFILPMFFFTPDVKKGLPFGRAVQSGMTELKATLKELKTRPAITRFLIARMLYQDGVNGVLILGGAFAAGLFGWGTLEIGIYGIILNIVAIGSCIAAGFVDQRLGSRNTVLISLALLLVATIGIVSTYTDSTLFGLLALPVSTTEGLFSSSAEKAYLVYGILIGIAFGPVQASSRSYLARNVTVAEAGRYFGIYALSGRATSFMATLSFSLVTYISGSAHLGMATLTIFLGAGFLLLLRVPEKTRTVQS